MKPAILFVDDEPRVLNGLRRTLVPYMDWWDMEFIEGGEAAIAALERRPRDIVVSDMVMPGMDGAELMRRIYHGFPATIRIILTGHSDPSLIKRSLPFVHQYLMKPCEINLLLATLAKAVDVAALLNDEGIGAIVRGISCLPPILDRYQELTQEIALPEPSISRIADIVGRDLSITAKILRFVNSAFFGLRRIIATPAEAVSYLGIETVSALVLGCEIFKRFENGPVPVVYLEYLSRHGLEVGGGARKLARAQRLSENHVNLALIGGLLHDVGKLVLYHHFPTEYQRVILDHFRGTSLVEAERECLGVSHCQAGAYLLGVWGMSFQLVSIVLHHHAPLPWDLDGLTPLAAVHLVNRWSSLAPEDDEESIPPGLAGQEPVWRAAWRDDMKKEGKE